MNGGRFRHEVGDELWGVKASNVLLGGKDEAKIEYMFVVKVPTQILQDKKRRVPGRSKVVIVASKDLTRIERQHYLPKKDIIKVYRMHNPEKQAQVVLDILQHQNELIVPTKEELAWVQNLQRQGRPLRNFQIKHGPLLLGPGKSMKIERDAEGKAIGRSGLTPSSDGDWSAFTPCAEIEPEKRYNVPVKDRLCVVIASKRAFGRGGVEHGMRLYLLVHKGSEGPAYKAETQAMNLEGCALMWASENMQEHPGCVSLTVANKRDYVAARAWGDVIATNKTMHFSSLQTDTKEALKETRFLCDELKEARERNQRLDCSAIGDVIFGAKHAIASLPGEEMDLRAVLMNASEDDVKRTFSGEPTISLCPVWTGKKDDAWWREWKNNITQAYDDGQILLVFSRRDWENRTEEEDATFTVGENKYTYLPKPYAPVELKKGDPIRQYGLTQTREIAWLQERVRAGDFQSDRIEYRAVETLDEIRAIACNGDTYRGGYDVQGRRHGFGTATWATGGKYVGYYERGNNRMNKEWYEERNLEQSSFKGGIWESFFENGEWVYRQEDGRELELAAEKVLLDLHSYGLYIYSL